MCVAIVNYCDELLLNEENVSAALCTDLHQREIIPNIDNVTQLSAKTYC